MRTFPILLYALFALAHATSSSSCGTGPTDVLYINENTDVVSLSNCSIVNASLHINGQHLLNSIDDLSMLQHITGYLYIWHTPDLKNLSALSNLQSIDGDDKYFGEYSVFIGNNRALDDPTNGLCWADTIDWSLYTTNNTKIFVGDNTENCSACFAQCKGCWIGDDPQHCQKCENYQTGVNCVESCPIGTIVDNVTKICQEFIPIVDTLIVSDISSMEINLSWIALPQPNGLITKYSLVETFNGTNTTVYEYDIVYNSDGFDTNTSWSYHKTDAVPFRTYTYTLRAENGAGVGTQETTVTTHPIPPPAPNDVAINTSLPNEVLFTVMIPEMESPFLGFNISGNLSVSQYVSNNASVTYLAVSEPNITTPLQIRTCTTNGIVSIDFYSLLVTFHESEFMIPSVPIGSTVANFDFCELCQANTSLFVTVYNTKKNTTVEHNYTTSNFELSGLEPYTTYDIVVRWTGYGGEYTNYHTFTTLVGMPPIASPPILLSSFTHGQSMEKSTEFVFNLSWPDDPNVNGPANVEMWIYQNVNLTDTPQIHEIDNPTELVVLSANTNNLTKLYFVIVTSTDSIYTTISSSTSWDNVYIDPPQPDDDNICKQWWFWLAICVCIALVIIMCIAGYQHRCGYNNRAVSNSNIDRNYSNPVYNNADAVVTQPGTYNQANPLYESSGARRIHAIANNTYDSADQYQHLDNTAKPMNSKGQYDTLHRSIPKAWDDE
jgi:hypothetical protein